MIFTIERAMYSTEWLAKIDKAEYQGEGTSLLRLVLVGNHGRVVTVLLDEDAAIRHLERAVGEFEDPSEIVNKNVVVILDRLGDIVTFHAPLPFNYDEDRLAPPPPAGRVWRNKEGQTYSEVGVGPKFNP